LRRGSRSAVGKVSYGDYSLAHDACSEADIDLAIALDTLVSYSLPWLAFLTRMFDDQYGILAAERDQKDEPICA
jgi:hypothetical protein